MTNPNEPTNQDGSGDFPAADQPSVSQTASIPAAKDGKKDGVSPEVKRTATMSVLHKTQKMVKGGVTAAKSGVHQAAKKKDMTVLVVVVVVSCLILGIVAVAWFVKPSQPTTASSNVNPSFENDQSLPEEVRSWKLKTAQEVNDLTSKVTTLETSLAGIDRRLADQDKTLKDALAQISADFNRAADQKLRLVEELARAQQAPSAAEGRTAAILDQFRRDLTSAQQSPAEAKARAAQLLRQAGYPDERIKDLLADVATKSGRISTGNVAEPPLSAAERATAPEWVRPLIDQLHDLVYGQALTAGRLYPEQIEGIVGDFLRANGGQTHLAEVTPELVKSVSNLVRVRRENLTAEQEDALPLLVTLRDEGKVDREDRPAIANLVWSARERLPEGTTPGQLLTIAQAIARAIGPTTSQVQDAPFKLLDAEGERFATEVVTTAAFNAIQMGKTQSDQYTVSDRALTNYLDTSRYQASPDQRRAIILRSMNAAQQRAKGKPVDNQVENPRPTVPTSMAPSAPAAVDALDDRFLYFGPLKVERGRAIRALGFVVPTLAKANALDPMTPMGASAIITGYEQLPRLVLNSLRETAGKPMGGRALMSSAIPELIMLMRQGEVLGRVPVQLSPDEAVNKTPAAQVLRGAVLGSIYGPFVQDGNKAIASANEMLPQIQEKSPLTPELQKQLEAIPADKPYVAVITAYEAFRPGRFGYSPERYQDLVQRQEALFGQIGALRDLLADQMKAEQIGVYEENLRLFIPLAIAAHDEQGAAPADIITAVRADIWQYTTVFLAENKVGRQVMETIMPRYAAAIASNDSGQAIIQNINEVMGQKVAEFFLPHAKEITPEAIVPIATRIAEQAIPVIENAVVQEAVISRVQPRIKNSAASGEKFETAMAFARKRVGTLVAQPYTPARIDTWASQLTEETRRVLEGGSQSMPPTAAAPGPDVQGNPGKGRTGLWPAPGMVTGVGTGPLVGTTTTMVRTRKVEIPAISYADAHLLTGVDAEIGGRSNLPIVVNVNFAWQGPAQSRLVMRNCRLSGTATAMAGPERVAIDLKKLSFVFPSGRSIHAEVNGYVTDNEVGQYGAKGVYNWNVEKVLPLAMLSGGAQGAADALKNSTSSTVVGITGATASVNTGDQLQQALTGGVAGGFGIMGDFFKSALTDVKPSVWLRNGKQVSVMLLDPVEIDVPESEFSYITAAGNSGFAP